MWSTTNSSLLVNHCKPIQQCIRIINDCGVWNVRLLLLDHTLLCILPIRWTLWSNSLMFGFASLNLTGESSHFVYMKNIYTQRINNWALKFNRLHHFPCCMYKKTWPIVLNIGMLLTPTAMQYLFALLAQVGPIKWTLGFHWTTCDGCLNFCRGVEPFNGCRECFETSLAAVHSCETCK